MMLLFYRNKYMIIKYNNYMTIKFGRNKELAKTDFLIFFSVHRKLKLNLKLSHSIL